MIDFGSLPGLILIKIFNFLSLDDILNLRLTCSNILRSTNCKEVFKRVKVQVSKSTQRDYKILMNVLHKFGSYVELDIACSFNSDIMSILPSMTNVQDISADIRCFRDICSVCTQIRKLHLNMHPEGVGKCDFKLLSNLKEMRELTLDNSTGKIAYLDISILGEILRSAKSIFKITCNSLRINGCNVEPVKDIICEASHIKDWVLINNNVNNHSTVFKLPRTIESLISRGNRVTFQSNCYSNMTKLVISSSHVNWERTQFPNLRTLELKGNLKGNGLDKNKTYFPNLKVLGLRYITELEKFTALFSSRLNILILSATNCLTDHKLTWIMKTCQFLPKLVVEYVSSYHQPVISVSGLRFVLNSNQSLQIVFSNFSNFDIVVTLSNFEKAVEILKGVSGAKSKEMVFLPGNNT